MSERALYVEGEFRSLNEEKRQATFTASTENPVETWGGREVLRMTGARLARFRKNPVVLDSHNRFGLDSVIGRADVKVQGRELVATITYAPTTAGERAWELVRGDFVKAVSIGYTVNRNKVRRLSEGETDGEGDALVKGPASIVREWELLEISNVPVPADADAVRRSFYESIKEPTPMSESVFARAAGEGEPTPQATANAPKVEAPKAPAVRHSEEIPEERAARLLIAKREAALAITPRGLEHVTEAALLEDNATVETVRAALKKAQAERFKPSGTPEPSPIEEPKKREESKAIPAEITDDVLARAFRGMRS